MYQPFHCRGSIVCSYTATFWGHVTCIQQKVKHLQLFIRKIIWTRSSSVPSQVDKVCWNKWFASACQTITGLVKAKLFTGSSLACESEEKQSCNSLTMIASRYPVVPLDHEVADKLLASHIATLLAVEKGRTFLKCHYIPNPYWLRQHAKACVTASNFHKPLSAWRNGRFNYIYSVEQYL